MLGIIPNSIAITCYLLGAVTQNRSLSKARDQAACSNPEHLSTKSISWVVILGCLAISTHSYLLYRWIDIDSGQNLTVLNLLSLTLWLISCLLIIVAALRKPIAYLAILIFPLAALSIVLTNSFPAHHIVHTAANPKQLIHIILSIVAFSILVSAGLQALVLAWQEKQLRQKYSHSIIQKLPPLETMEKLLFQMIAAGAVILGVVVMTSIYFFHAILLQQLLQKTILALTTWIIFIVLLIGRHFFGWRGKKAIYCTIGGVLLLTITYFSSMIIMELLP
jgi:ABC-type uncharacterized transport system permease subunit